MSLAQTSDAWAVVMPGTNSLSLVSVSPSMQNLLVAASASCCAGTVSDASADCCPASSSLPSVRKVSAMLNVNDVGSPWQRIAARREKVSAGRFTRRRLFARGATIASVSCAAMTTLLSPVAGDMKTEERNSARMVSRTELINTRLRQGVRKTKDNSCD